MPAQAAFLQSAWLPAAAAEGALTSLPPAQSRHQLSKDDTKFSAELVADGADSARFD